ncbi:glycosyltransferase family protein [Paenibacillus senegalensis]|uniref:glycosyltransferase family protein n=1 Tax=Paenibacillus senegalensis TaxID=1465766 RepID=UPI00028A0DFA|nr:glycosyltransferase [Paenibacillus senegalensis]
MKEHDFICNNLARQLTVVFASHTYIGSPFVVGSHHLANQFAKMGHTVFHLSTPISPAHLLKVNGSSCRVRFANWLKGGERRNRVINYVPFTFIPWNIAKYYHRKNLMYSACWPPLPRKIKQYGIREIDLLLIDQYSFVGLEELIRPKVSIYRATDLYSEMGNDQRIDQLEEQLVQRADGIIATSAPVLKQLRRYNAAKPWLLLENGVDFAHFYHKSDPPSPLSGLGGPIAIYAGALDDRLDRAALKFLATALPELQLVLIGPCNAKDRGYFQACSNVHLLGQVDYAELPYYLNYATFGLLPLSDHPANEGRSPMKLYEYAASGLPVIARHTKELGRREERHVHLYKSLEELIGQARQLMKHAGSAALDRESICQSAHIHSWESKAEQLIDFAEGIARNTGSPDKLLSGSGALQESLASSSSG